MDENIEDLNTSVPMSTICIPVGTCSSPLIVEILMAIFDAAIRKISNNVVKEILDIFYQLALNEQSCRHLVALNFPVILVKNLR